MQRASSGLTGPAWFNATGPIRSDVSNDRMSAERRPVPPRPPASTRRRGRRWIIAPISVLVVLALVLTAALARLGYSPVEAWQALRSRQTMELVRYAEFRLLGHPRLESVLLPLLGVLRHRLEREPALPFVDLGKGQQAQGLAPQAFDAAGIPEPVQPLQTAYTPPPATRVVGSVSELAEAMEQAEPGAVLELAPGNYRLDHALFTGHAGEPERPITLRAARPEATLITVATVQAFVVNRPYWVFENLHLRGVCPDDSDCEHAFHVVGAARGTVIRNSLVEDFNAPIKINGEDERWPDDGLLQFNTLSNTAPRRTGNPVTMVDLVAANGWRFVDNRVENFVKAGGNGLSYGMFMKGAGAHGRIERNLVVCTTRGISQPGLRVGLSMGGGGTGASFCRDQRCQAEHSDGVIANNVVAHCNDVGIDVNRSVRILVAHNTLVNTLGMLVRGRPADMDALDNLVEGGIHTRDGAQVRLKDNLVQSRLDDVLLRPDALDLRWLELPTTLQRSALVRDDFCGRQRPRASPPGATVAATCVTQSPAEAGKP